jgi:hypothetical protein
MKCHRCQGLMVMERFYGPGMPYWGFRCLFCGEILDPLILENRNDFRKPPSPRNPGFPLENSGRR